MNGSGTAEWDLALTRDGRVELPFSRAELLYNYACVVGFIGAGVLMVVLGGGLVEVLGWVLVVLASPLVLLEVTSPRWGRPAMVVTRDGVAFPTNGYELPWSMVHDARATFPRLSARLTLTVAAVTASDRARPPTMPPLRRALAFRRTPHEGAHVVPGPLAADVRDLAPWLVVQARRHVDLARLAAPDEGSRGPG